MYQRTDTHKFVSCMHSLFLIDASFVVQFFAPIMPQAFISLDHGMRIDALRMWLTIATLSNRIDTESTDQKTPKARWTQSQLRPGSHFNNHVRKLHQRPRFET